MDKMTTNESLISIIVPIYNVEHQMHRLLDSLLLQTWTHFEVLLIDDGSTDRSGIICEEYTDRDPRFKVIHKQNEGVGTARQVGLDAAIGEFVIHADADDWIESSMLYDMLQKAEHSQADVVIADFYVDRDNVSQYRKQNLESSTTSDALRALFYQLHGSCWNKLARTSTLRKYGCIFYDGINYCEDFLFWAQLFQHEDVKIDYLNKAYYHYVMNSLSITNNYTLSTYNQRLKFYNKLKDILRLSDFEKELRIMRLNILTEGFVHNIVFGVQARSELLKFNKRAAFCETKSLRWWLGYLALAVFSFSLARKLLRF